MVGLINHIIIIVYTDGLLGPYVASVLIKEASASLHAQHIVQVFDKKKRPAPAACGLSKQLMFTFGGFIIGRRPLEAATISQQTLSTCSRRTYDDFYAR